MEMQYRPLRNELSQELLDKRVKLDISNIDLYFKSVDWHTEIEDLLKCWGEKSGNLAKVHTYEHKYWRQKSNYLTLTSIFITTVTSSISLSTTTSSYHEVIMYIIGFFGFVSTLLQAIKQFYNADDKSSEHKLYSKELSNLYRSVKLQLSLRRTERGDASDYIKWVYKSYDRLCSDSPPVTDKTVERFKQMFTTYKSATPDLCETDLVIVVNTNNSSNRYNSENINNPSNV